jgi:hypothetical protein
MDEAINRQINLTRRYKQTNKQTNPNQLAAANRAVIELLMPAAAAPRRRTAAAAALEQQVASTARRAPTLAGLRRYAETADGSGARSRLGPLRVRLNRRGWYQCAMGDKLLRQDQCHDGPGPVPGQCQCQCRASTMPGQCHDGPVPCRASAMPGQCHAMPGQCQCHAASERAGSARAAVPVPSELTATAGSSPSAR